jgi:DNA transformation protein
LPGGQDFDHIAELFSGFGPVNVRRMFSGAGVFADGLMLALAVRGIIYLKADERTFPAFDRENCGPFTYQRKSQTRAIGSFRRMPERLYDEPDELAQWAAQALEAARRSATAPRARRTTGAKTKRPRSRSYRRATSR